VLSGFVLLIDIWLCGWFVCIYQ